MQQSDFVKNLVQLNIGVLLVSTSGVLGKAIDMWPPMTIGIRAVFASILLLLFLKWKKITLRIAKKDISIIILGGILMGVHWVTYFQALRLSNVAIGMLTIYTYPAMSSILEPLILKTKFQKIHLLLGILVLIGIYFLVPEFNLEHKHTQAVGYGLISALAYALRNIIMKKEIKKYHGSLLMGYQMLIIAIALLPISVTVSYTEFIDSLPILLALAVVTTAIGHTIFLMSLKHFNVTTASIISSVQPVYGIIMAYLFLSEVPRFMTLVGGGLIIATVIFESLRSAKKSKIST